jgi:hypothetical protein
MGVVPVPGRRGYRLVALLPIPHLRLLILPLKRKGSVVDYIEIGQYVKNRTGFTLDLIDADSLRLLHRMGKIQYIMYIARPRSMDEPVRITHFYACEDGGTWQRFVPPA